MTVRRERHAVGPPIRGGPSRERAAHVAARCRPVLALVLVAVLVACSGDDRPGTDDGPPDAGGSTAPSTLAAPTADAESVLDVAREERVRGFFLPETVEALRGLVASQPGRAEATELLRAALLQREDWNGLVALLSSVPIDERSDTDELQLASVLVKAARHDEAAELLARLTERRPDEPTMLWLTALTDFQRGRLDEAAEVIDGSLPRMLAAGHDDALLVRGIIHLQSDEPRAAADLLSQLVTRAPDHVAGHEALARVLLQLGDAEQAATHREQARLIRTGLDAQEAGSARLAAQASALDRALSNGDLDRAEALLAEMIPRVDGSLLAQLLRYRARVHDARGRKDAARTDRERAEQIDGASR